MKTVAVWTIKGGVGKTAAATLPSQPAAKAFAALWEEIKERLELPPR